MLKYKILPKLILAFLAILIVSCNSDRIFVEHQDVKQFSWSKEDAKKFSVDITETSAEYNIYVAIRHVEGFQFKNMKVVLSRIGPDGSETGKEYNILVVGEDNLYLGSGAGDIWDLEAVVEKNVKFDQAGKYEYTIMHNMPADPVNLVMEVGLIVEKAGKE